MDQYQTLQITQQGAIQTITLNRPQARNSLNAILIQELLQVLERAEQDPDNRILILQGQAGIFCMGMDFKSTVQEDDESFQSESYMLLLRRLATIPRVVIARVEGTVMAGGIGLVAASDLVLATPESQFSLSEALWGLLPCCVAPYLIRRVGFQVAYRLTLTTQTIMGEEAHRLQLVDVLTQTPDDEIRKLALRLNRLHPETLHDLKQYFRKMWLINEAMETTAVQEITRLMQLPRVQQNLVNYVQKQQFPWEVSV